MQLLKCFVCFSFHPCNFNIEVKQESLQQKKWSSTQYFQKFKEVKCVILVRASQELLTVLFLVYKKRCRRTLITVIIIYQQNKHSKKNSDFRAVLSHCLF